MPAFSIEDVLAELRTRDPGVAGDAEAALNAVTGGDGPGVITQARVQRFCWYTLPVKFMVDPGRHHRIAAGAAEALDLLGLDRYAEICRSEVTAKVIDGFAVSMLRALLQDPEFVAEFSSEYAGAATSSGASGFENQIVIEVGDRDELQGLLGRTLADIAQESDATVVEVLVDLALRSDLELQLKSGMVSATEPSQALTALAHSAILATGSDGGAHTKSFGHGQYATDLLIWLVRDTGLMTVEDMHFQMSYKPARSVQIHDRGALLPGYWADVLIYDLDELYFDTTRYEIVHDMPNGDWRRKGKAGGYHYIMVNGEITHQRDHTTGQTPGVVVQTTTPLNTATAAS